MLKKTYISLDTKCKKNMLPKVTHFERFFGQCSDLDRMWPD